MITIPWLILERTDSPAFAGLVAAVSALPGILVSPIGGWMVDHIGRRAVSISADLLSAVSVAAFPIVAATFGLSDLSILLIALLGATFDPAGYTARKTLLADVAMASDADLDHLNGIHDGTMGVAWIFGPAVGAGLIASVGAVNSFWFSAALFLIAALVISFLRVGDSGKDSRELAKLTGEKTDTSLRIGAKTLWDDKLLRTLSVALLIIASLLDVSSFFNISVKLPRKELNSVFSVELLDGTSFLSTTSSTGGASVVFSSVSSFAIFCKKTANAGST
jgi:MFS family permease